MAVAPIKPEEVPSVHEAQIPDAVFEAFNALIVKNMSGSRANVRQDDVVALLLEKGLHRGEIYENRWLDIEAAYRRAGWKVHYDKPAYNESYAASFLFEREKKEP